MSELQHEDPVTMQRREILRRAAWLLGGAISAPAALAILQGCSAREASGGTPVAPLQFLDAKQFDTIAEIAEIMLPKTDTAGARDVGVAAFIDAALAAVYPMQDRVRYLAGYAEFERTASSSGKPFLERVSAEREGIVKDSLLAALTHEGEDKPFMLVTRELALLGYFTSRMGITENMEYVPVPAAFHGCVPLSQMKKRVYWE
jgi:hypothetical protein